MNGFATDCREKAARMAERAAAYRMAGARDLAAVASRGCAALTNAADAIEQLHRMEADAAERMQA